MKLQFSSAILLWVLSDPTGNTAEAWIPTHLATTVTAASATRRSIFKPTTVPFSRTSQGEVVGNGMQLHSSTTNDGDDDDDDEDEEECADAEECDIDWSKMPGCDDDEPEQAAQAQASARSTTHGKLKVETTAKIQKNEQIQEEDDDDDDEHIPNPLAPIQVRNLRLRMEMQWQMTEAAVECDVDNPPTCGSEPCEGCKGRGKIECRFCRGTTVLWMLKPGGSGTGESSFTTCSICQQGTETCRSCQGSGWVSGWAKLQLSE